ncbi:MAG: hypothetical protein ACOY3P_12790 [Planctomycetota bacterium]
MADLTNARWMYAKAAMFLVIGAVTFFLLLMLEFSPWSRAGLQILMIWAFARAYYFAFYVIEHYVDGNYRFAGLIDFAKYVIRTRANRRDP